MNRSRRNIGENVDMTPRSKQKGPLPVIGWREWIALPDFSVVAIKVKVDTGARSSALHAYGLRFERRNGEQIAVFEIHPVQRKAKPSIRAEAVVREWRKVTSSGGHHEVRPVVVTDVELLGRTWPVEVTLTSRDSMGFRMLLGRQAVRRRFVVDPGRSFVGGRPAVVVMREER